MVFVLLEGGLQEIIDISLIFPGTWSDSLLSVRLCIGFEIWCSRLYAWTYIQHALMQISGQMRLGTIYYTKVIEWTSKASSTGDWDSFESRSSREMDSMWACKNMPQQLISLYPLLEISLFVKLIYTTAPQLRRRVPGRFRPKIVERELFNLLSTFRPVEPLYDLNASLFLESLHQPWLHQWNFNQTFPKPEGSWISFD